MSTKDTITCITIPILHPDDVVIVHKFSLVVYENSSHILPTWFFFIFSILMVVKQSFLCIPEERYISSDWRNSSPEQNNKKIKSHLVGSQWNFRKTKTKKRCQNNKRKDSIYLQQKDKQTDSRFLSGNNRRQKAKEWHLQSAKKN